MSPVAGVTHDYVLEDYDARNPRGLMAMRDRRGNRIVVTREAQPIAQRQLTMGELTQSEEGPSYKLTWFQDTWIKGIGGLHWQDAEDRGKLQSAVKIETYPRGTLRPAREVRVSTNDTTATTKAPSGFAVAPSDTAPGTGFETELWSFQGKQPYSGGDDNWTQESVTGQDIDVYYRNGTAFDKWVVVPAWWGGTDFDDVAMPYAYKARTETSWTASTSTSGRFKYFTVAKNNANTNILWGGNHVFDIGKTVSGAHSNSVTTITASADVSSDLAAGDIIICGVGDDAEQEPMLVTAVSGTSITVIRAYGDTAVTYEGGEKIHLYSPHGLKSSSDPSNAGSWSSLTKIGEQEHPITGLAVDEDSDTLLIAKTDGLWQQYYEPTREGGRLFIRNLTIQFRAHGHPTNFQGIHAYAPGKVLLPLGSGGLLDYNVRTGDIRNISFSVTMPELTDLHGQVLAITSGDECIYLALKDKSSEVLWIMAGHLITVDGATDWSWEVLAKHTATTAITDIQTNIWYDGTRVDHKRVWYGFTDTGADETPRFIPIGDVDDDKTDGYTNDTDGEAVFVRYTGNLPRVPKHFTEIEVESKNLGAGGRQWTFNHRVDDPSGTFVAGDAANVSPFQTIRFPKGLSGKLLELQAVPAMTSVGTTAPEIVSIRVSAELRPDPAKIFPMEIYLADNQYLLNGTEESKTRGNLDQLNKWNESAADLTLFTPDKAAGRQVIFLPGTMTVTELSKELGRRSEYRVSFLLAEV
jgi:hypothetical protein